VRVCVGVCVCIHLRVCSCVRAHVSVYVRVRPSLSLPLSLFLPLSVSPFLSPSLSLFLRPACLLFRAEGPPENCVPGVGERDALEGERPQRRGIGGKHMSRFHHLLTSILSPPGPKGSRQVWARGGEGALAEPPRATRSRPHSGIIKFFIYFSCFFDLRQPQGPETRLATELSQVAI